MFGGTLGGIEILDSAQLQVSLALGLDTIVFKICSMG